MPFQRSIITRSHIPESLCLATRRNHFRICLAANTETGRLAYAPNPRTGKSYRLYSIKEDRYVAYYVNAASVFAGYTPTDGEVQIEPGTELHPSVGYAIVVTEFGYAPVVYLLTEDAAEFFGGWTNGERMPAEIMADRLEEMECPHEFHPGKFRRAQAKAACACRKATGLVR